MRLFYQQAPTSATQSHNFYFILKRQRLIHEIPHQQQQLLYDLTGYDSLSLPHLPPQFQNMQLPQGWFVPGKKSEQKHTKIHECELFDMGYHLYSFFVECSLTSTSSRGSWSRKRDQMQITSAFYATLTSTSSYWVTCGVKMMSLRHGWGWQPTQPLLPPSTVDILWSVWEY
jgi:hypothetical protein